METIIILIALCVFLFLADMFILNENIKLFRRNSKLAEELDRQLIDNAKLRFEVEELKAKLKQNKNG